MATAGGPDIERDGLVFGYDTSYGINTNNISSRYFKGRNNTNYLSDGLSGYNVVQAANWNGATPTFTLGTSEFGTPIGSYNTSGTSYMYSHDYVLDDDLNTLSGQTVTFSVYLKRDGADSNIRMRTYDNVSGYTYSTKTITNQFQRYTMTKTLGSSPTRIFVMIDNTGGGVIDFHSPQLEIGSQASPFIDGTRSSTQSLIDLTRTSTIDVSNVSFDSTGQPTFDGTDDYIQTSLTGINLDSQCTIEGVLQRKSTPTAWRTFFNLKPSGANTPFFEFRSGANSQHIYVDYYNGTDYTTNAASFTTGTYGHAVATYDGAGNVNMYFNGELIHTKTGVPSFALGTNPRLTVGRAYDNSRNTDIEAPVVKIYNRALSAQEVQQNYNAYKNRFNI